jgi:hypothetical protein
LHAPAQPPALDEFVQHVTPGQSRCREDPIELPQV